MSEEPIKKKKTNQKKRAEKENLIKAQAALRKLNRNKFRAAVKIEDDSLTLKQRRFAEEYLVDFDVVRAAKIAGYAYDTTSNPYQILQRPNIKKYIAKRKEELKEELAVDQGRVVREFYNIAYSDISSYYTIDEDGFTRFKSWEDLTENQRSAISEVSFGVDKEGNRFITRIKLFDKMRALEGLGKHIGFFEKDNKQKSELNVTIEQVINELPEEIQDLFRAKLMDKGTKYDEDGEGSQTCH